MPQAYSNPAEWAIQAMSEARTKDAAREIIDWCGRSEDYLGGRILAPSPSKPGWRAQTFYQTNGEHPNGWLPDGMRHVIITPGQRAMLLGAK